MEISEYETKKGSHWPKLQSKINTMRDELLENSTQHTNLIIDARLNWLSTNQSAVLEIESEFDVWSRSCFKRDNLLSTKKMNMQ